MKRLRRWIRGGLVALFVLGVSIRTYSLWVKGIDDDPTHHPDTIFEGRSAAPDQYRVLYPLLWKALSPALGPARADDGATFLAIVLSCGVLFAVIRRETRHDLAAALGVIAFHGACAGTYHYFYRETFLDVALSLAAFAAVTASPRTGAHWGAFILLSFFGTLNRESWLFVLCGAAAAVWAAVCRGGLTGRIRDLAFLGAGGLAAGVAYAVPRLVYGLKPYFCTVFTYRWNVAHLLPWKYPEVVWGHGVWSAGCGLFVVFVGSLFLGNRRHLSFIGGYGLPFLVATFLMARWIETRIFFPLFAMMICSVAGFIAEEVRGARK